MRKIYRIHLTSEERAQLETLCKRGRSASKAARARALLLSDEAPGGPAWKDVEIRTATGLPSATLERLRKRCCKVGAVEALIHKKREHPPRKPKITAEVEARLIALARSEAPDGRRRWTLRLLADKLVELQVIDSISPEAVRRTLKRIRSSHG